MIESPPHCALLFCYVVTLLLLPATCSCTIVTQFAVYLGIRSYVYYLKNIPLVDKVILCLLTCVREIVR